MPLPPAPDDATRPLDNSAADHPVSFGAAEFRALKDKINKLFLLTGVDAPSGPDPTEKLVTTNGVGILTHVVHNPVNPVTILYGFATIVNRTGQNNHSVAFMGTAINNTVLTGDRGTFGVVTQVINSNGALSNLIAAEFAVANLSPGFTTQAQWGINIVFKNRGDGEVTPGAGLGANGYNKNSVAIQIDSQPRGTAGEFCGWANGIVFGATSMDAQMPGVRGYCLDAYNLTYDGGLDPDTAFRVDAVIRMRSMQSILWFDGVNKIKMFFDPSVGRMKWVLNGVEKFSFDIGSGVPHVLGVPMTTP